MENCWKVKKNEKILKASREKDRLSANNPDFIKNTTELEDNATPSSKVLSGYESEEFYTKAEYLSRVRMKRHFTSTRLNAFTSKVVVAERTARRHV